MQRIGHLRDGFPRLSLKRQIFTQINMGFAFSAQLLGCLRQQTQAAAGHFRRRGERFELRVGILGFALEQERAGIAERQDAIARE